MLIVFFMVLGSSDDLWPNEGMNIHILDFTTNWILGDSDLNHVLETMFFVNTFVLNLLKILGCFKLVSDPWFE